MCTRKSIILLCIQTYHMIFMYIYIHMSLFSHKCLDPTYCPSLKSFFVISNFLGQDDEPLYIYSCVYIYICIHISQNPRRLRDPQKMAIYVCFLHDLL